VLYHTSSLRDYNESALSGSYGRRRRSKGLKWALLGTASGVALGLFALTSFEANALRVKELDLDLPQATAPLTAPLEDATPAVQPLTEPMQAAIAAQEPVPGTWHEVTVQAGDSLARIFSRREIPARQLHELIASSKEAKKLTHIYPGQKIRMRTTAERGLMELVYEIDALNQLHVIREDDTFRTQLVEREPERRTAKAEANIEDNLFLAAQKARLPENIIMELAGIFGWDIDFALDIRKGDRFALLYEELYLDGDRIGTGDILAAEFVNRDKVYQAVRYTDERGHTDYYDPTGRSMRKDFLRTPVDFTRISSRFSLGRKHPILNRIRAHRGVDYAAPTGTPVKATGNGKIVLRGRKGGYGNTIVVRHGSTYSTLYAHLSRFASGLKTGSRVRQGQIIGYVGSTGLATGPHLHYEFHVNGVHRNPLTVKLPPAAPLPKQYREDFKLTSESLLAELKLAKTPTVALRNDQ
jgi:murein DD-endopeptidase MepM/ murein hydrolase activator NlpD